PPIDHLRQREQLFDGVLVRGGLVAQLHDADATGYRLTHRLDDAALAAEIRIGHQVDRVVDVHRVASPASAISVIRASEATSPGSIAASASSSATAKLPGPVDSAAARS